MAIKFIFFTFRPTLSRGAFFSSENCILNEINKKKSESFIYNGACEFNIFQICTIFCMNKLKNNTEGNVSHEHHVHILVLLAMALAAFLSQIKKFDTLL